ncbi:16S rRNA processing protein RimM [bacterium]|nr:MAG: 16S rRNA processing protein RimM [bacterium]
MSTKKPRPNNPRASLGGPSGEKLVAAGRFGRPHGVLGEVRLDTMGNLPKGLHGYSRFFIDKGDKVVPVEIEGWREADKFLLLRVAGTGDRDSAARLTGKTLYVPRSEMPPLGEGEYYYADLEGMAVVDDESGRELGEVADVKPWGDYDMLFIRSGGRTWLLPVLGEFVIDMDLGAGIIRVKVPEGLGP